MPVPDEPRPDASDNVRADRAEVESHEVVTANRAWWDANAESYYAEHGDFLGDDRLVWGPEGWTEDELDLLGSAEGAGGRDGHEGRDILEVGAGAAQGSRYLAGRGARVVASDVSMGMLRRARRIDADRAAGRSFPTVPLVQCDGCVLPFADAAFDVVFTAYGVLPFVVDAPGFFRECARVLRAGGRLVAAEPHPIRWCFADEPDYTGLTVTLPYWDRRAYTERDSTGRLRYAETHPTLGSRIEQIVDAGLRVQRLVEPEWPDHNPATWGGWSPLRGQYLPGSVIWVLAGPDEPQAPVRGQSHTDEGVVRVTSWVEPRARRGRVVDHVTVATDNSQTLTDLQIARSVTLRSPHDVARRAGIDPDRLIPFGRHVAKVEPPSAAHLATAALDGPPAGSSSPRARYIVVTALTPTPLGEGKTTTAIGLADGLARGGDRATLTLRQPSMGPTFGIKGGAAGAGYSQVVPMEQMNLHLTGDFHAITAAHNLLAAMIDNHLHQGNALRIDTRSISWRRVLDVNDRSLRNIVVGLGERLDGVPRQTGFDITAASEVGVALALATSLRDLRVRMGRIVIGYDVDGAAVTAEQLRAAGAMTVMLSDAIHPNLLQTLEGNSALVHCGPFGNIATGNSSILADLAAIEGSDYVITEAGFGSDMGAERFVNVKCRLSGLRPDAAVLVVTVRALKAHSGRFRVVAGKPLPPEMLAENVADVLAGADNLRAHLRILKGFGISPVVAINAFPGDHGSEHDAIAQLSREAGAEVAVSTHVRDGGQGAAALAEAVRRACEHPSELRFTYEWDQPLDEKIEAVATRVYAADGVDYTPQARRDLARFTELGYAGLPVVIAKTHLSISSDPKLLGSPTGWRLPVREVRLAAGAGFVYAIAGTMRTMPGLGSHPGAERIDIDENGEIVGLS